MTEETNQVDTASDSEKNSGSEANASKEKAPQGAPLRTFFAVKSGMTRIFDESGSHIPVTVLKITPNKVTQIKTQDKDGYQSYQIGYYPKRDKLVTAPVKGQLKKAKVKEGMTRFCEIRETEVDESFLGQSVSLESFKPNTIIDVTGVSKGKGFQGVMKRFNFSGGPAAHGSKFHRTPGSIGMCQDPGRLFKNTKLPGHMGDKRVTVQNLKIVDINQEKGFILVKGAIPGSKNSFVKVSLARKQQANPQGK